MLLLLLPPVLAPAGLFPCVFGYLYTTHCLKSMCGDSRWQFLPLGDLRFCKTSQLEVSLMQTRAEGQPATEGVQVYFFLSLVLCCPRCLELLCSLLGHPYLSLGDSELLAGFPPWAGIGLDFCLSQ